ncbi:tRNA (adenosine(37)-N6)-dimethylallyltransferase MiaA [bacterium]|nr:tRNA (adenosine(37)-N6)-dimethylallyltransferase MiaA [bacterium]MBU1985497.1 tRNA (adenosine(37)-N6)-dimethylallyltransferase MiaA [bacterium]
MTGDSNEPSSGIFPVVLILAGTTASGKTDVSIPLAESLKGEILSADSRQIFREMRIGTAKPTESQRKRVPHHFIDEKSISERWTAGDFARSARERIEEIISRERTPIVVGGSMLYLRALVDGFYREDSENPADYTSLREEAERVGLETLYTELQERDPALAARTNPNDGHRILRGLLVCRIRGVRLSDLQDRPREPIARPFRTYFLHGDRRETYERTDRRVLDMMREGLIEEVRGILELGFDERACNALRTHGYQEIFPYLRGEISRERMIVDVQKAVRHYVKRQMTWFRREPRVTWIRREFSEPAEAVAARIEADFQTYTERYLNMP